MTEIRVRATELGDFVECRMKWWYRWRRGLRAVPQEAGVTPMLSGSAIHFGIQAALLRAPSNLADPLNIAIDAAKLYLEEHGEGASRFSRGVEAAIAGLPNDYWYLTAPQVEDQLEIEVGQAVLEPGYRPILDKMLTVIGVGKPDLWQVTDQGIEIVDFKSTSKDETERLVLYQVWNLQPRYYAVIIDAWLRAQGHEVPPIYTRHFILSTRGKHALGAPYLISQDVLDETKERMVHLAQEMYTFEARGTPQLHLDGSVSPGCKFCDFNAVDEAILTGGDAETAIADGFTTRAQREERENLRSTANAGKLD